MQRLPGLMLVGGGLLTLVVNAVLSPQLPVGESAAVLTGSQVFLWRLSLAAAAMLLLLLGLVGLRPTVGGISGAIGVIVYVLAFAGTAMLFAHEWAQVFFVHQLAVLDAPALEKLDDSLGPWLDAVLAASVFALGWVALSIWMLAAQRKSWLGPVLVVAGFIAIPALGSIVPGLWGQIAGNVVLSSGWIVLGLGLLKREPA
jgi:hypothetical protein